MQCGTFHSRCTVNKPQPSILLPHDSMTRSRKRRLLTVYNTTSMARGKQTLHLLYFVDKVHLYLHCVCLILNNIHKDRAHILYPGKDRSSSGTHLIQNRTRTRRRRQVQETPHYYVPHSPAVFTVCSERLRRTLPCYLHIRRG